MKMLNGLRDLMLWWFLLLVIPSYAQDAIGIFIPSDQLQSDAYATGFILDQRPGEVKVEIDTLSEGGSFGLSCISTPVSGTWDLVEEGKLQGQQLWIKAEYVMSRSAAIELLVARQNLNNAFSRWLSDHPMFGIPDAQINLRDAQALGSLDDMIVAWQWVEAHQNAFKQRGYAPRFGQDADEQTIKLGQKLVEYVQNHGDIHQAWLLLQQQNFPKAARWQDPLLLKHFFTLQALVKVADDLAEKDDFYAAQNGKKLHKILLDLPKG